MAITFNQIQHLKKREFLASYSETGNVTQSAEQVGIDRSTHYVWMKADPEYPALFELATEMAGDKLEQEARRRAVHGVSEPVFYQGQVCGTVQKYSDTLLIVLLKGAKGEKYKDRGYVEQVGKDGGPIQQQHTINRTAGLPVEEKQKLLAELLEGAGPDPEDELPPLED